MIYFVLIISELFHAFAHTLVLFNYYSIKRLSLYNRRVYFFFDLVSVLLSYYIVRENHILVSIHLIIHILAILQLYVNYSSFFNDVHQMAEMKYFDKSYFVIALYIIGTSEDILVHLINSFYLLQKIQI